MKRILCILFIIIPLSGCLTTAVVSGAAMTGSVLYDKRSIKTILQDRHITQTAQNLLNATPEVAKETHISVATFNNTVLMIGQAQSSQLRDQAFQLISSVPNVKKVFNQVAISGMTSSLQKTNDTWLTTKVRTSLLTEPGLNSSQIKVVTENSNVYLMGEVTQTQANLSTDVTRRIPGVTKVIKVFDYLN